MRYEAPSILATYAVDELVGEAATCVQYGPPIESDRLLKDEIEAIEGALEQVKSIRTS